MPWAMLWVVVGMFSFSLTIALVVVAISEVTSTDINTVLQWTFKVLDYTVYIFLVIAASYGVTAWLDKKR